MPQLSVIIPTHQRSAILAECLRCLECQTLASDIEVIVVSDGEDDKTAALFAKPAWRVRVKFFSVPKSQQGHARNEGIRHAEAKNVLFIGDDIFLAPDACEWHIGALRENHSAVLGFTTWDSAVGITPVMQWLESSGWQFGYPTIAEHAHRFLPADIQHRYTYTSHISLPLAAAKKHAFRTDVHLYGWEDIEWGMRLKDDGVRVYYEPHATALHHHRIELADSLRRMETLGRSAVLIGEKSPGFDRVPRGWKRAAYNLTALLPTMAGRHRAAFLRGIQHAESGRGTPV